MIDSFVVFKLLYFIIVNMSYNNKIQTNNRKQVERSKDYWTMKINEKHKFILLFICYDIYNDAEKTKFSLHDIMFPATGLN